MSTALSILLVQLRDGRHRARVTGTVDGRQRTTVREGFDRADCVSEAVIAWYRAHERPVRRVSEARR